MELSERIERLPQVLGRYLLVEALGKGGMGAVYHALQLTRLSGVERFCVVKLALPRMAANRSAVERFVHEARTSMLLHHKNLCTTYDVDVEEERILIAMESIAGCDLRAVFQAGAPGAPALSTEEAVAVALDALDGLEYAHTFIDPRTGEPLSLVHRDISPHNLMISWSGEVKVIDFGVALSELRPEVTGVGQVVGKVRYMAPEQTSGGVIDRRADVFCVAVVLAELLSNRRFWGQAGDPEILGVLAEGAPLRSPALDALSGPLRAVIERALAPHPRARFGSAAAFRDALRAVVPVENPQALLRPALARLFPGVEGEQRAHLQELYRIASAAGQSREQSWQDHAPTQRNYAGGPSLPGAARASIGTARPPHSNPQNVPHVQQSAPRAGALLADAPTRETPLDATVRVSPVAPVTLPSASPPLDRTTRSDALATEPTVLAARPIDGRDATTISSAPAPGPDDTVRAPRAPAPSAAARSAAPLVGAAIAGVLLIAGAAALWRAEGRAGAVATDDAGAGRVAVIDAGAAAVVAVAVAVAADGGADAVADTGADAGTTASVDAGAAAIVVDAGAASAADVGAESAADAGVARVEDAGAARVEDGAPLQKRPKPGGRRAPAGKDTKPAEVLPPRPARLGDRLRYLKTHCAAQRCSGKVAARAAQLSDLPPDAIRALTDDVDACLDRCGAP